MHTTSFSDGLMERLRANLHHVTLLLNQNAKEQADAGITGR